MTNKTAVAIASVGVAIFGLALIYGDILNDKEDHLSVNEELPILITNEDLITIEALLLEESENNPHVSWNEDDEYWQVTGDGLPNHETGAFPNEGNPNTISEQNVAYRIPKLPIYTGEPTNTRTSGVSLGGIKMEPGTAERDAETGWPIEALQDMLDLGLDFNNAHVQPTGTYHYHGIAEVLTDGTTKHSPLVGFASDGFPIYAQYGFEDPEDHTTNIIDMQSSWQLKTGARATDEPNGEYDGTYTNDFEYIEGSGDLDECNGRFTVTPEYPQGTYAYFMTNEFPYIHRCVKGEVDESFAGGGEQGVPPSGQQPPPGELRR